MLQRWLFQLTATATLTADLFCVSLLQTDY
jgi:hypothetical protein